MTSREIQIQGVGLSDGIAIGKGYFLEKNSPNDVPDFPISAFQVESEVLRYRKAVSKSREELNKLKNYLTCEEKDDASGIIDSHLHMLNDPMIVGVEGRIRNQLRNTEAVFRTVINEYIDKCEDRAAKVENDFFKQRLVDVKDLSERIMWHLRPRHQQQLKTLKADTILLSDEIVPSDAAEALRVGALAFVTHVGGETSHAVLIAKARGIPFVADVNLAPFREDPIDAIIVDGHAGKIILNPEEETLEHYRTKQAEMQRFLQEHLVNAHLPAKTTDGVVIDVLANIDSVEDMEHLQKSGATGVGLFRSEYLFLEADGASSEEYQFRIYSQILETAGDMNVTFRLFDVGGDKDFFEDFMPQPNPALGCRAIRFLMYRPSIFRTQVRALLRAAKGRSLRVLIPLVSDVSEVRFARKLIFEERDRLSSHEVATRVEIGVMVEVPSAVMVASALAKECDFFSIGTNDLTQYALAVDRSDTNLRSAFQPLHPSILRLIAQTAEAAGDQLQPLSLCGDLAAEAKFAPLLIGLGVRRLSCPPPYIPAVKAAIRATSLKEAQALAKKAQTFATQNEVLDLLNKE